MGIKGLWTLLTPHADRKPICELRGKIVAIDLAGWICESLNVVDYFVHPRHHLKNLFFRTCYLLWEDVTPVFILEGVAPKLKSQVMAKRNEIQFRGVKPKGVESQAESQKPKSDKGRSHFNHVLKQCENLLNAMGIQCVQGPGEAEAYGAFLNLKGLVDGIISQDSDCFAYGALRVYRNFSVSSQGSLAAQGGAVDIYDMDNICSQMDFGQNKAIVMALLCGCDYCPEGVGGVGRDSVLKLFKKYHNDEILRLIRSWRSKNNKYSTLEIRVDDKTVCSNCGHIGRTLSHTKKGCGICRTNQGCCESLWKEERLSLKAEITVRKKALADPSFPSEEIIEEFLKQPEEVPKLQLDWRQPNIVKFIKQVGNLLQWPEIYSFQKFFPVLTRWQILNAPRLQDSSSPVYYVTPKEIVKKRVIRGVPSLEILWQDANGAFKDLIPDIQLKEFLENNPKGLQHILSTIEPLDKAKAAYPSLVESFLKLKEKPKKMSRKTSKITSSSNVEQTLGSLENFHDLINVANNIAKSLKPKRKNKTRRPDAKKGIQMIDRFFKKTIVNEIGETEQQTPSKFTYKSTIKAKQCSTPIIKTIPSDLESDDDGAFDMSDIVNGIVSKSQKSFNLSSHKGKRLCYETITQNIGDLLNETASANNITLSMDDFNIPNYKRSLSNSFFKSCNNEAKRISLDDSFDVLVKMGTCNNFKYKPTDINGLSNTVDRFKQIHGINLSTSNKCSKETAVQDEEDASYFFSNSFQLEKEDEFERIMQTSVDKQPNLNEFDDFRV